MPDNPQDVFGSCSNDAAALAALPRSKPDVDIVQRGPGGPVELAVRGRSPESWFPRHLLPQPGNDVITYTYGTCFFRDLAAALDTATAEDHRVYILGWDCFLDTELAPGKTLRQYLARPRVQVRAMLWDGALLQPGGVQIRAGVATPGTDAFINSLPNGASILDTKHAQPATHHQKLVVVQGELGLIAFLGGMDIAPTRTTVDAGNGLPWHDTHIRLSGPGARACRNIFEERWADHPASPSLDGKLGGRPFPPPPPPKTVPSVTIPGRASRPHRRWVAIGRTYPKPGKYLPAPGFRFAPNGVYTAWDMIEHGIRTARRTIYLEDQYLVSRMARALLLDKVRQPGFQSLLILMNNSGAASADYKFLIAERNRFREDLRAADRTGRKWGIHTLDTATDPERQKTCGNYVHSKTWIFDDEFAIVGSANCENRGYTLNTEAVAGIADDTRHVATGQGFARRLRIALWHKHLGVPHATVQDWDKGLALWRNPPPTAMVKQNTALEPEPGLGGKPLPDAGEQAAFDLAWTQAIDPDAR